MRVVIADDLSGAAEIAGIAHRHGWSPVLLTQDQLGRAPATSVLVIDAHTRDHPAEVAAQVWQRLTTRLLERFPAARFFKKCDSVLRGHIAVESRAMAAVLGVPRTLLVPANPSRGRTIIEGNYLIEGKPLHTTAFAHDPAHPATRSQVQTLLGAEAGDLAIPDLHSVADVVRAITAAKDATLIVGAADAFTAWCPAAPSPNALTANPTPRRHFLIVNGSTAPAPLETLRAHGVTMCDATSSLESVHSALRRERRVHAQVGPEDLNRLQALARMAVETGDTHLALTGGATARAACDELGLACFTVSAEWTPGVVSLLPKATTLPAITIKPGSYPWPAAFLQHACSPEAP